MVVFVFQVIPEAYHVFKRKKLAFLLTFLITTSFEAVKVGKSWERIVELDSKASCPHPYWAHGYTVSCTRKLYEVTWECESTPGLIFLGGGGGVEWNLRPKNQQNKFLKRISSLGAAITEDQLKKEYSCYPWRVGEGELSFTFQRTLEEGGITENPEGVIHFLLQPRLLPVALLHLSRSFPHLVRYNQHPLTEMDTPL